MKPTTTIKASSRNDAVRKAYQRILKEATSLIATIERHELRCTLQREDKSLTRFQATIHEIISPLFYLSLQGHEDELSIHFGFERLDSDSEYHFFNSKFLRLLYKFTALEHTTINIEDCIHTDYIIVECSALYETLEDRNRHFQVKVITYKPKMMKRKLQKVA